jgi:transposase
MRDRLEMVRLSDARWSVPRIARHLGQHEQTVRVWIKAFLAGGLAALPNKPRGGKQSALTAPMLEAVRAEVATGRRTWTAAQLAAWVADHQGVRLSAARVRIHLRRAGISWQRTSRTLRHKPDPAEVAEREAVLTDLEKKGRPA